jgi:hypothetical protein
VVNYGTAAPEIDLPGAREEFLNAFPSCAERTYSFFLVAFMKKKAARS